jgi:hypothetical protein
MDWCGIGYKGDQLMDLMLLDSSLCKMDSTKLAVAKTLREDATINTITSHIASYGNLPTTQLSKFAAD